MGERNSGEGGVPIAHAPETEEVQEEGLTALAAARAALEPDVPQLKVGELLGRLEARRASLQQDLEYAVKRKESAMAIIKDIRAELVEVERVLKAAKPRGKK